MKKVTVLFIAFLFVMLGISAQCFAAQRILMAVYDDNPDYAQTRQVFRAALEIEAKKSGMEIEFIELKKTRTEKEAFIQSLKKMEPDIDMVFVSGTSNALAVKQAGLSKPVLFTAVANPKKAKLLNVLHTPDTNFTGCYCEVSASRQLHALLDVLPEVKRIGILYNPYDPTVVRQVEAWEKAVSFKKDSEIRLLKFLVPEDVDDARGFRDLVARTSSKVDVLITTIDEKIIAEFKAIIQAANENNIPTYAALSRLVEEGALVSYGFDFEEAIRTINVPQAVAILKGAAVSDVPVGTLPEYMLVINLSAADALGIKIADSILEMAAKTVRSNFKN